MHTAAGEVAFIMQIGALLEDVTTERAKKELKILIAMAPETGRAIENGRESTVPLEQIVILARALYDLSTAEKNEIKNRIKIVSSRKSGEC